MPDINELNLMKEGKNRESIYLNNGLALTFRKSEG